MSCRRRIFYRRSFLNAPGHHAGAHVIAFVRLTQDPGGPGVDAEVTIADCNRTVTLDFWLGSSSTAAERRNAVRKARLLADTLAEFADGLELALDAVTLSSGAPTMARPARSIENL